MAAIWNATSNHSSLNLRWTHPAILIISTFPSRLRFARKPAIMLMQTKMKIIHPSRKLRIIAAESTSCQRSLGMTKRRCFSRNRCYLNYYSNNKPNGRRWEPKCFPNSTTAKPPTDQRILEISPQSLRCLTPYSTAAERKNWIHSSKH